ncbi:hypothetical protein Bbelb_317080 [Branchiostoma belcheri]|nr:hypothetical protein Bbelb_317080 [Branchiostoma belcheri]
MVEKTHRSLLSLAGSSVRVTGFGTSILRLRTGVVCKNNPELLLRRVEQLEKAHQADEVRDALHQVLDLARALSQLNTALLMPALQQLEEKARASGHEDLPKYAATLHHATLHAGNLMLGEMVLRALGSDIDEKIGAKFAKVAQQGGTASKQFVPQFPVQPPQFPPPPWYPALGLQGSQQPPVLYGDCKVPPLPLVASKVGDLFLCQLILLILPRQGRRRGILYTLQPTLPFYAQFSTDDVAYKAREHQKITLQGLLDGRNVFLRTGGRKSLCYMSFQAAARSSRQRRSYGLLNSRATSPASVAYLLYVLEVRGRLSASLISHNYSPNAGTLKAARRRESMRKFAHL